ncbi:2-C-methyl-D-erythritol 4-phosphate cytidylyltransferase [bacterium]|nr:2-C-methyl-D-erythritol 4-phosphate cytidylyltransferase [bacterium]
MSKTGVVIVAGGDGSRFKSSLPKGLVKIGKREMFLYSLLVFQMLDDLIEHIVLVVPDRKMKKFTDAVKSAGLRQPDIVVKGRKRRQDSVRNGLKALPYDIEYVLIHDAARPFLIPRQVRKLVKLVKNHGAATMAVPVRDTLRGSVEESGVAFLKKQIDRENLYALGTPQGFVLKHILSAHEKAAQKGIAVTDDTALMSSREKVAIEIADLFNVKLTYPDDILLANALLNDWKRRVRDDGGKIPRGF